RHASQFCQFSATHFHLCHGKLMTMHRMEILHFTHPGGSIFKCSQVFSYIITDSRNYTSACNENGGTHYFRFETCLPCLPYRKSIDRCEILDFERMPASR